MTIRFSYSGTSGSNWALDDIGLTGTFQPITYQWSPITYLNPANGTGQQVVTTPTVAGPIQYCVTATTATGCTNTSPACVTVTVNDLPVCSITGNDNVCPSSTNTYSGPAGMTQYTWTITGNATIISVANTKDVSVLANASCGTYTLTLVIRNSNNCTSTCNQTYTITDTQNPTLTCPAAQTLCYVAAGNYTIPNLIATDNCTSPLTVTYNITGATTRTGTGINASGSFNAGTSTITWTVTDACNNTSTCSTIITISQITATATPTAATCNGAADGSVVITANRSLHHHAITNRSDCRHLYVHDN